jgi:hypothetical protein
LYVLPVALSSLFWLRHTAFFVIKYYNTIVGGILFSALFRGARILCFMLENYIGIEASLQNPNRHNLVWVLPDEWTLHWMRPA